MKYYDLGALFMGKMLYVALDEGVYGERDHQNAEEAKYLSERFKEFTKNIMPELPRITRHREQPLAWGHEIHDGPKCVYCGKPPHIGICPENTRGY